MLPCLQGRWPKGRRGSWVPSPHALPYLHNRRFYRRSVRRQSRCRLPDGVACRLDLDAERGAGDESFGDGISRADAGRGELSRFTRCAGLRPLSRCRCAGTLRWRRRMRCGAKGMPRRTARCAFTTLSGELTARRVSPADAAGEWIELDFPAIEQHAAAVPMEISVALGAQPVSMAQQPDVPSLRDEIRAGSPRSGSRFRQSALAPGGRGMIATARAEVRRRTAATISSRAGSARRWASTKTPSPGRRTACSPLLGTRLGKREMVGYQASARGGIVRVAVEGDRVKLRGQAVTILRGELLA